MHELQDIGERLVSLRPNVLATMPLPDDLRDAVMLAQRIASSREGRRRQLQYIGRLMRTLDARPIREALERAADPGRHDAALQHAVERWRERLIAEPGALDEWAARHGASPELARLVDQARAEQPAAQSAGARRSRAYRELFRQLRAALDSNGSAASAPPQPDHDS